MAEDVETVLNNLDDISHVIVFNGRGLNKKIIELISRFHLIFIMPDWIIHSNIQLELAKYADRIIWTKPKSSVQYHPFKQWIDKLEYINPMLIETVSERNRFTEEEVSKEVITERSLSLGFLGHFSPWKFSMLTSLSEASGEVITVVGEGWKSNNNFHALGKLYGHGLKAVFNNVKVSIAIPDLHNRSEIDPITVRYFQYPFLGSPAIYYRNDLNAAAFTDEIRPFTFASSVEFAQLFDRIRDMDSNNYGKFVRRSRRFSFENAGCVENLRLGSYG
jgi:hypothetical protein